MLFMELDLTAANLQMWLLLLVIAFLVAYNYLAKEPWIRLPPGPPALPVVGSLPFLGQDMREALTRLSRRYGKVFTVFLGSKRVVVLTGYNVIREAFVVNAHTFSGRPAVYLLSGVTDGYGIASTDGSVWSEQRRHVIEVLRGFGFGRPELEERIVHEIGNLLAELRKHASEPYNPQAIIQTSVANIIASMTFGRRMGYSNPAFLNYLNLVNRSVRLLGSNGVINLFPFLRYLPGDIFRIKQLQRDIEYLNSEYDRLIAEHKLAVMYGQQNPDFISAYLSKISAEKQNIHTTFTEKQLRGILMELFAAGSEGTSTTLTWAVIYLTLNQDVQRRVHAEIDKVLGSDEVPRMQHRSLLPFTEATIMEVQRLADVVPLGIPHSVTEDVYFRGYFIPKDTMILANMNSVHRDPELWPEPEKFKPERFLDETGRVVRREELIPFSVGSRLCIGQSLAKMELFLYLTAIMQKFHFRLAPGYPAPDTRGTPALTNIPKPFHVLMEMRSVT